MKNKKLSKGLSVLQRTLSAVMHIGPLFILICALTILPLTAPLATAAQTTLSWDPPVNTDGTPVAGITGYKLYIGTASRSYSQNIDVGNVTSYTMNNLSDGATYYFTATDYDNSGNVSGYSNEVSKSFPFRYSLMATASEGGTIAAIGNTSASSATNGTTTITSVTVDQGVTQSFSITPNAGFRTQDVVVDGASVGSVNSYTFSSVTAAHSLAATFTAATCQNPPVKIAGDLSTYQTLQAAYNADVSGKPIQSQAMTLNGNLNITGGIPVTMNGGYACDYLSNAGYTTIIGTVTISSGTLTVNNIIIG
jgi:hypothetical protein